MADHPLPGQPSAGLAALFELLHLEAIEQQVFRGRTPGGAGRLYGGLVMAQALMAAGRTVPQERLPHSLHGYFLRPGSNEQPVLLKVEASRDGRSFATRNVVALQDGQAIFSMTASFQQPEAGLSHSAAAANVRQPDAMTWPDRMRQGAFTTLHLEHRQVEQELARGAAGQALPPHQHIWIRANGPVPEQTLLHSALLTYQSDQYLLSTSRLPHLGHWSRATLQRASLDHAMWFHQPPRVDDWLLYALDSPSASGARGYNRGSLHNQAGQLVASTMQECLMRNQVAPGTQPATTKV